MAIHDKTTATRMAACAALGLHYWSGHPIMGRVWAVDDNQQPHIVRVYVKEGFACLQQETTKVAQEKIWPYRWNQNAPTTVDNGPKVPFSVSESTQELFKVAA